MENSIKQLPSILVADGDEDNLYLISMIVQDLGFPTVAVKSGASALLACQRYQPVLALLETRLLGISGSELVAAMKCCSPKSAMKIIAVTSAAMPGDHDSCLKMGFDNYLPKPYAIADLEQLICQYACCPLSLPEDCRNSTSYFRGSAVNHYSLESLKSTVDRRSFH